MFFNKLHQLAAFAQRKAKPLFIGSALLLTLATLAFDFGKHPFLQAIEDKLSAYRNVQGEEKVYLQLDRTMYDPGESVWFAAYVRDANSHQAAESQIVYVQLLDARGSELKKVSLICTDGVASGDFQLEPAWAGGTYKIKAYTARQEREGKAFERDIVIQKSVLPNLSMKLDFKSKAYGPGDQVSANLNLQTLENKSLANHDFSFDVQVDGERIEQKSGKTDANGLADIRFTLPYKLNTNDGLLLVRLNYKGQTESISRSIPIRLGMLDVQFLPEGGSVLAGLDNRIAFKALDEYGKAADIVGDVYDSAGKVVASFNSYHQGMGSFSMTPKLGEKYSVKLRKPAGNTQSFKLPVAQNRGYGLSVTAQGKNDITLAVRSMVETDVFVVLQGRDSSIISQELHCKVGETSLTLPVNRLPYGIARVTLFDANQVPQAERLVFVNRHQNLQVEVSTNKQQYLPREEVKVTLRVKDAQGRPVKGNFSVAVVDEKLLSFADDKQGHLLSYMFLESELNGQVEEPNFYFDNENDPLRLKPEIDRGLALDNLLMTQGWSRFEWKKVLDPAKPNLAKQAPEKAMISGVVVDEKNMALDGVEVFVSGLNKTVFTNKNGQFSLDNVKLYQPIGLTFSYPGYPNKSMTIAEYNSSMSVVMAKAKLISGIIRDDNSGEPLAGATVIALPSGAGCVTDFDGKYNIKALPTDNRLEVKYIGFQNTSIPISNAVNTININMEQNEVMLDAVVVSTSVRRDRVMNAPSMSAPIADRPTGAGVKPGKVPEVKKAKNAPAPEINDAVDEGMAVPAPMAEPIVAEVLVEAEEAFKIAEMDDARFFAQNKDQKAMPLQQKPVAPAQTRYYQARTFYVPVYKAEEVVAQRNDFRKTIYWNPSLVLDERGEASFSFFNSDALTQFSINVEGFDQNGMAGRSTYKYFAQQALGMSAKVPFDVIQGDIIRFPLLISNATSEVMSGRLTIICPDGFTMLSSADTSISVPAGGNANVYPAVLAGMGSDGKFVVSFVSGKYSDKFESYIKTRPRGFPMYAVFSGKGNKADHTFSINSAIPGSMKAAIRLFPNALAEVMAGMASMLRMPSGCFEQTTSSNYPNLLALQYMRETNSTDTDIETRAKEYLATGYQRLAGYESPGGGFDWWGRAPAHEALTAMGIMQFVDMKSVYDVDQGLIDRANKWLMSRRDGKGGWNRNPNALHSWCSNDITDAYIVWALCEAGLAADIKKELEANYNKAISSEDPYHMALLANALYKTDPAKTLTLVEAIAKMQKEDGSFMGLTASVTNSTGKSLAIETSALVSLAMMRLNKHSDKVNKAIAFIQASKDHYGFGSTQGTVLALKAIIEHTKRNKVAPGPGLLVLSVNGKKVAEKKFDAGDKEIAIDDFAKFIQDGKQTVSFKVEQSKIELPYEISISYGSTQPGNHKNRSIEISNTMNKQRLAMGETVRMNCNIKNISTRDQPSAMAMVGIPAGLSVQPWQLKELVDQGKVDFYELFEGYVVFHFEFLKLNESKDIKLDLKADIPGKYSAAASTSFPYYTQELRHWASPNVIEIVQ